MVGAIFIFASLPTPFCSSITTISEGSLTIFKALISNAPNLNQLIADITVGNREV